MSKVQVLADKAVDLIKLYNKGHFSAEEIIFMLEDVLVEDGYMTREEIERTLIGSVEGEDLNKD